MQPGSDKLLAKAERARDAARGALVAGAADLAAGRAFAALLNAAKARLNEHGLRPHSHARIVAALAGLSPLDGAPADWLADALRQRQQLANGDGELDYADVGALVERAERFVTAVRDHLSP